MASGVSDEQLRSVFQFEGKPYPEQQSSSAVAGFVQLLSRYCSRTLVELPGCDNVLGDTKWRPAVVNASKLLSDNKTVRWFPEYGCALIAIGKCTVSGGPIVRRALYIVCCDNWTFSPRWISPPSASSSLEYGSVPGGSSTIHAGAVDEHEYEKLLSNLNDALAKAAQRRGDQRTAAGGKQGHQRTPAMIEALLKDAKAALNVSSSTCHVPRGGFADVGLHTGGKRRDTAWPLTHTVFQALLMRQGSDGASDYTRGLGPEKLGVLFNLTMADFDLRLLEQRLPHLSGVAEDLNQGMLMLKSVVQRAGVLTDDGHVMATFRERIHEARQALNDLLTKRMTRVGAGFSLPDARRSSAANPFAQSARLPRVVLPSPQQRPSIGGAGFDVARFRSTKNLAGLTRLQQEAGRSLTPQSLENITAWVARGDWAGDLAAQLLLGEVESLLFSTASSGWIDLAASAFGAGDVAKLEALVGTYVSVVENFSRGSSSMSVELHSRKTLVCWIAYAVIFVATSALWPGAMESFGVCLREVDLQYLVLSDKLAVDAALKLARYLRSHTRSDMAAFSLADGGRATFCLADEVSRASSELWQLWESEAAAADERRDAHWGRVQSQQRELMVLRESLRQSKADLSWYEGDLQQATARRDIDPAVHRWNCSCSLCTACNSGRSSINQLRETICTTEASIRQTERIKPILQALPEDEEAALQMLFFLHMPAEFRSLSHLSFQAQQMLLPREWDSDGAVTAVVLRPSMDSWSAYYNSHQPVQPGQDGPVVLGYRGPLGKPEEMVERCTTPWHGVWHPDSLAPGCMLWKGGWFSAGRQQDFCFDPFSPDIRSEWTARAFTEQLSDQDQSLQWAMPQYGISQTSPERSNLAIVNQSDAPEWLGKRQFLAFGGVRAYPLAQQRKLVLMLRDRTLPLGRPAVRSLVCQALYQIGELSPLASFYRELNITPPAIKLLWRHDQEKVFAALVDELQVRVEEIAHTPREHESMQLLVDMAVYVSHWNAACKALVRSSLVKIPREWAYDIDHQVQEAEANHLGEEVTVSLKAKQCLYFTYGVLCYGGSDPLSAEDIANMCELQVLAHNRRSFAQGGSELGKGKSSLEVQSLNVMAKRSHEIEHAGRSNPGFITAAVKLVLDGIPSNLPWVPVGGSTACFEARHGGHLYSTNLLTGVVLFDGWPPGRLPADITQDSLYLRVFGEVRFEVAAGLDGVFRTTRATNDRSYEFSHTTRGGELVIVEIDEDSGERLELLRNDGSWAKDLPVRLRTMHSHWLCRDRNTIVFRPTDFNEGGVDFIAKCSSSGVGSASCYRVPPHLRSRRWQELLESEGETGEALRSGGRLVLVEAGNLVMSALAKFEPRAAGPNAVVHTYFQRDGGLNIDLPRFGLSFKAGPSWIPPGDGGPRASGIPCMSHDGYQLACDQQLGDTLPELTRYLVLVREDGETMILVPRGKVVVREGMTPRVWIECEDEGSEDGELQVLTYSMHRRWGQPDAGGLSARLQLAAMFAATGTLVPDPRAGMTGSEKALELIRRCSVNHPLQQGDLDQLLIVMDLSGGTPALALLCGDLLESSKSLHFLYSEERLPILSEKVLGLLEDAATAYEYECETGVWHARRRLTAAEEARTFGGQIPGRASKLQKPAFEHGLVDLPSCPISDRRVHEEETGVWKMKEGLLAAPPSKEVGRQYPLEIPQDGDTLTADMHAELRSSWEAHQRSPSHHPALDPTVVRDLHERFAEKKARVTSLREGVEKFVLAALANFGTKDARAISYGMHYSAGLLPTASAQDLPSILWSKERARMFNPFLSEAGTASLQSAVVLWLRLCVLEDKLGRLERWAGPLGSEALMWQELQVTRTWDPAAHPKWLAFEAESGLQVRPAQAEVALHMIDNPGDIVQLNMGEGKTRVILPLLVLHWAVPSEDAAVVRLHFLGALIGEAFAYLHHILTGTLLECPLFLMPFNRDVNLTLDKAQAMRGCLERCRRAGGAVLVTPEHRQSLYLKGLELVKVAPEVSHDITRLQGMRFRDVFDESDELFHHRKQLIYAVGGLQTLPGQKDRVDAVQALLRALKHRNRYPKLAKLLSNSEVAVEEATNRPEQFGLVRLLPGPALDSIQLDLHAALMDAVLSDPPYEMRWLSNLGRNETFREKLMTLVLDESVSADQVLEKSALADEGHWQQLLALRGLLAHGTLLHCMQMRPRVNYGVSRAVDAKKRLAVPFRASNTPADRSEFRQSDVAIIYTVLSYYYDGLSPAEFRQVLTVLLEDIPESAQADIYNIWLAEVKPTKEDMVKIGDVLRVDLTNEPQMDLLHHYFAYNFEVVNSWLSFVVLPVETKLCPKYIGTNAWFLADNATGEISRFSGTNDNHRLLPLQVRKNSDKSLPSLFSTNGKMLDLMMRTERYETLGVSTGTGSGDGYPEAWRMLLNFAVEERAHVLVDSGALLGSVSSEKAADFLLSSEGGLPKDFRGVVYFDPNQETAAVGGEWMVLDWAGRCVPLAESALKASEAFSIYDEARCRGADLKLSPDAKALLTIGPKNGKDKVMQAAGRLRLLGRSNQSILFVGTPDVSTKIREVTRALDGEGITPKHVLGYVMANTVEATRSGLLPWVGQGLEFSATFGRPERAEQDEVLTLDAAYGARYRRVSVDTAVSSAVNRNNARFKGDVHKPELSEGILSRAQRYGKAVFISRDSAIGGECEREMELEMEEEEEVEREVAKMPPRKEIDWDYAAALTANSRSQLSITVKTYPLAMAWNRLAADAQISAMHSTAQEVFYTRNFLYAVADSRRLLSSQDDYLRSVDTALVFANGQMVLLSERETDGILLALSRRSPCYFVGRRRLSTSTAPKLVHVSYTTSEENETRLETNPLMRDAKLEAKVSDTALAPLWVFSGWTTVPEHAKAAVKAFIKGGRRAVGHIVAARGHGHLLPRSDLERLLT